MLHVDVCGQRVDSSLFLVLVRELVLVLLVAPPSCWFPPLSDEGSLEVNWDFNKQQFGNNNSFQ